MRLIRPFFVAMAPKKFFHKKSTSNENRQDFALCLNCIDGRTQMPLLNWILKNYPVKYVDLITEPGIDGVLADENRDIHDVLKKVDLSIKKHGSRIIFIAGHSDCKGNDVSNDIHKEHILAGVRRLKPIYSDKEITGVWMELDKEIVEIKDD